MIIGAHTIIFTTDAEADRKFFKEVLNLGSVDTGDGWLIFKLPDNEMACHPATSNNQHELYLLVENIETFIHLIDQHQVDHTSIQEEPWGRIINITLPSGSKLGIYQPLHKRP